jgi:hypothetical protein
MFMFAKKNCDTLIISTIRHFESGLQLMEYAAALMKKEQKKNERLYKYCAWEVSGNKKPRPLKDFRKMV